MKNYVMLILVCLSLAACGVKPGGVEPPEGRENNSFPQTYPNIETDPK